MRKIVIVLLISFTYPIVLPAHPAYGIVVDENRNIYFTDIHHNGTGSVWKLHNDGTLELLFRDFHAHNIAIDEDGSIYTAHGEGNHVMMKLFAESSEKIYETTDPKMFFGGNATYSKGRIIFGIDHFIWQIKEGKRSKLSNYYFEWNQSIYADPEGLVYATDKALKGGSIVEINENGVSKVIASNIITRLDRPIDKHDDVILGITKGCDGFIYVAETAGRRLARIKNDGGNETFYQPKDGWTPVGVDFFSGDAYVLEYNLDNKKGPRITRIKEDLTSEVIFEYEG